MYVKTTSKKLTTCKTFVQQLQCRVQNPLCGVNEGANSLFDCCKIIKIVSKDKNFIY